jgi:uncharacterized protein
MKRKYADRSDWKRILEKEYQLVRFDLEHFQGWVTEFKMIRVREPFYVSSWDTTICVADAGFVWLHYLRDKANHVITAMYDSRGAIVQWYIDIVLEHGLSELGVPYFDDLYLDVVVSLDGRFEIKDADELEEALKVGTVSQAQFDLAWLEANRLVGLLERGELNLRDLPTVKADQQESADRPVLENC